MYVKDTGRPVMKRIIAFHDFYNTGRNRLDNVMIRTGTIQQVRYTGPDNTIDLWFGKMCPLEVVSNPPPHFHRDQCDVHTKTVSPVTFGV